MSSAWTRSRRCILQWLLQKGVATSPLCNELSEVYANFDVELPEHPQPEIEPPDESEWLFDSNRDYVTQIGFYKQRKVKS
jgi:hypothetical protein